MFNESIGKFAVMLLSLVPILSADPARLGADLATQTADIPASDRAFYFFVRNTAFLSRKAGELDKKDGSGGSLRHAFSSTVGLTDTDAASVLSITAQLDSQFQALDQRAAAIAKAAKNNRVNALVPPPPSELTVLQQQKEQLMHALPTTLDAQFSDTVRARIAAFVAREWRATHGSDQQA